MKRVFASLLFTAVLPLIASTTQNRFDGNTYPPSSSVAYAGHTMGGNWCECGSYNCICDPGEQPIGGQSIKAVSDQTTTAKHSSNRSANSNRIPGFDFAST